MVNLKVQNIIMLFDVLVSDYVGGGELLHLLRKYGPLPEELCRIYFAELVVTIGILIIMFKYLKVNCVIIVTTIDFKYITIWY